MATQFEELDYQKTAVGELSLRRRISPALPDEPVYEVKLDDGLLMSSTVNAGERALARLALEDRPGRRSRVVVGGLGLGYTAAETLEFSDVGELVVVELLAPVIAWHRRRLVPMAERLMGDDRCTLLEGDFFELMTAAAPVPPRGLFDAILLDIDHAPDSWLHPRHAAFYSAAGLGALQQRLQPDGVFALWSAAEPSPAFFDVVARVFATCRSRPVTFLNPHLQRDDTNWIVIAERGSGGTAAPAERS